MKKVFAIFEGGGAKGISHVGALRAAELNKIEFVGVAGASAGAVIAALIAVGYKANQIFDPNKQEENILTRNGYSLLDMLGTGKWKKLNIAKRELLELIPWFKWSMGLLPAISTIFIAPNSAHLAKRIWSNRGYFDTYKIKGIINDLIRKKLCDHLEREGKDVESLPKWIRFKDLDKYKNEKMCTLKIVATDIIESQAIVFDYSTPNVFIADAVVASLSIPFVFEPALVRGNRNCIDPNMIPYIEQVKRFVDGGLISNLPTWVVIEEKAIAERVYQNRIPIMAFELYEPDTNKSRSKNKFDRLFTYIKLVLNTGIFGGQKIVHEFIDDLEIIEVETTLKMLQFDLKLCQATEAYKKGKSTAFKQIGLTVLMEGLAFSELQNFTNEVTTKINQHRIHNNAPQPERLRMSIVVPFGNKNFRVKFSYNMQDDPDDKMIIDGRNNAAPLAFQEKKRTFIDLNDEENNTLYMTKYERALIRSSLRSIIAVPIFDNSDNWELTREERDDPKGVLCIDSDKDLSGEFKDDEFMTWLAKKSVLLLFLC